MSIYLPFILKMKLKNLGNSFEKQEYPICYRAESYLVHLEYYFQYSVESYDGS